MEYASMERFIKEVFPKEYAKLMHENRCPLCGKRKKVIKPYRPPVVYKKIVKPTDEPTVVRWAT